MAANVTIASFKSQFSRAFTFGASVPDIMDQDITNAIAEKDAIFNFDLYPSDKPEIGILCEHYMTAHFLTMDVDAADSGGQTRLLQNSRGADGVSESVDIPDWMKESIFASTYYGQKFLMLSSPYLGGVVFTVEGGTNP